MTIPTLTEIAAHARWWHFYVFGMGIVMLRAAIARLEGATITSDERDIFWPAMMLNAILWPFNALMYMISLTLGERESMRALSRWLARHGGRSDIPLLKDDMANIARALGARATELDAEELDQLAGYYAAPIANPPRFFLEMMRPLTRYETGETIQRLEKLPASDARDSALTVLCALRDGKPIPPPSESASLQGFPLVPATFETFRSTLPLELTEAITAKSPNTHHVCLSQNLACSGLNPCEACFERLSFDVVMRVAKKAGVGPKDAGPLFTEMRNGMYELHAVMLGEPEIAATAVDVSKLVAIETTPALTAVPETDQVAPAGGQQ